MILHIFTLILRSKHDFKECHFNGLMIIQAVLV